MNNPKGFIEIKPGLFVVETKSGWKKVNPFYWNGKSRWKEQLATVFTLRTIITLAIIIFVAWSYVHDTAELVEFHNNVVENTDAYCNAYYDTLSTSIPSGGPSQTLGELKYEGVTNSLSGNS